MIGNPISYNCKGVTTSVLHSGRRIFVTSPAPGMCVARQSPLCTMRHFLYSQLESTNLTTGTDQRRNVQVTAEGGSTPRGKTELRCREKPRSCHCGDTMSVFSLVKECYRFFYRLAVQQYSALAVALWACLNKPISE